jgi:anti-sigma factor RsiW
MSCREIQRDIPLFVGDDLPATRALQVRQHIAGCPRCQKQAQEQRDARAWLTDRSTWQPSPQTLDMFRRSLRQRLEAERQRPRLTRWIERGVDAFRRWASHPGLAGAAALVLVLGVVGTLHLPPQRRPAARIEVPAPPIAAVGPTDIEDEAPAEDDELASDEQDELAPPDQTVLHIQTKDPKVRIIWLMAKGPEN